MDYRYCANQAELGYLYDIAQERMSHHREHAEKKREYLKKETFYKSEKEALKAAVELRGKGVLVRVMAEIGKDEEYYYLKNNWIATIDGLSVTSAEYIGFALVYDNDLICKIIADNANIDDIIPA